MSTLGFENLSTDKAVATQKSFCKLSEMHENEDISAVKSITLRVMQKNTKKGITTERYGSHHEVIDFVAATASESSVKKLREVCQMPLMLKSYNLCANGHAKIIKHPLFATNCHGNSWPEILLELVEATSVAVQKHYQLM